ncbi:MAG: glycosylase [Clostridiales bacterium]|nr:glycosylase [Clostridiales bacterium]
MPQWLNDAVFYEIYPQSFYDTNGDGIGDINGIIQKLDYVKGLGCNAIWLNPIYDSPFMDAGYDVRNYKQVAPRYGTNDDLENLFNEAHKKGIKILLDLVPGHTSDTHPWFQEAKKAEKNEYSNRYVFTNSAWEAPPQYRLMCGICERDGNYLVNFFSSQPALNYGFYDITHPDWQLPSNHPDCLATAEAMKDVMRFWLDKGADGFRVDMADSLVKNDEEKIATAKIWRGVREMLDREYPEAAMVAEWCHPERAINNAGFHMDFYLDHAGNGYNLLFRCGSWGDEAVFNPNGRGNVKAFADEYLASYELTKDNGYISFMTNNHDMPRPTAYLDKQAIKLVNAFIFTMPGVPFLYYGDEIGMKYQKDLVSKEGGFHRTGSRTPMQWSSGKNLGFSESDTPYLPTDASADAPTVENQQNAPDSIYRTVTDVIALRHRYDDLKGNGDFELFYEEGSIPFAYKRGKLVMFFNPLGREIEMNTEYSGRIVYEIGKSEFSDGKVKMSAQSFAMIEI